MALVVKNSPANAGDIRDLGSIPGLGRSPGGRHGNPFQYSVPGKSHGQRSLAGYGPCGCKDTLQIRLKRLSTHAVIMNQHPETSLVGPQKLATQGLLVVQWLRLHAPSAWGPGLIPGPGTRSHMLQQTVHIVTTINLTCCNYIGPNTGK